MGYEGQDFSDIAGGVSPAFVETLYKRFKSDPASIEPGWREPPEIRQRQSYREDPRGELARYLASTTGER